MESLLLCLHGLTAAANYAYSGKLNEHPPAETSNTCLVLDPS